MRKLLIAITIIAASLSLMPAAARDKGATPVMTASEAFTKLPLKVLEIINTSQRMDMLDYYAIDSIQPVVNGMNGISYLRKVTPTYLRVQITPVSTLQIKVLPYDYGEIIATSYTVGDSLRAKDSELRFFDTSFNELDTKRFFDIPELDDFIPKVYIHDEKQLMSILYETPFLPIQYRIDPDFEALRATMSLKNVLDSDQLKILGYYAENSINYIWNGKKFKKVN